MATLFVGPSKQFTTIAAAVAAARAGDTVSVAAGTYVNDLTVIRTRITLVASGGQVTLLGTRPLASGGALLTLMADATIDGFVIAGAAALDGSAAGLLVTSGSLVLRNSLVSGNQTGLLVQANAAGTVTVTGSEFAGNGAGDGFSHNIAVGAIKALTVQDSYIHDAAGGAEIRSRAAATTITNTRIADNAGTGTVSLDLPNGGAVVIQGSVIEKGAAAGAVVIREGGDTAYTASSLRMTGTTVVADRAGALLLQNTTPAAASLTGNTLFGFTGQLATGLAVISGNVIAAARPAVSTAPLVAPAAALPAEAGRGETGRAGAVVASGVVRTVGAAGAYRTVAAAVAAAGDGDTIRVAAGTYADDGAVIGKRLIIEGVGGMARFVASGAPMAGRAVFTTSADVTFRNIEITGAAVSGGVGAAVLDQGGRLTLVNSYIHDNQAGLVAAGAADSTVSVYDTEFARNGTPDGRGGNVDIGTIGTLTLRNAWIHDGLAGPELRSRADTTVLDGSRISQAHGAGAADIDLPDGGRVTITNSALGKGVSSQVAPLVHVGGGTAKPGSSVSLANVTLTTALTGPTVFVAAEPNVAVVTAFATVFAGGAAGSTLVQNGTATAAVTRGALDVAAAAPWAPGGAPAAGPLTAERAVAAPVRGVLSLSVSGTAWHGDPRFTVAVDGAQVADTLAATAAHGAGMTQRFTIAGDFAPGPHSVTVRFVNDLNGAGDEGRALYLDAASFNGEAFGKPGALMGNGAITLSTGVVTRPTAVTVSLSEDAWHGDAQAFIAIDGTVLNGMQTVTASHAAGASTAMRFVVDLAPGPHVATVSALNSAGGRALYVDQLEVAGQVYAGSGVPVAGASAFAFTVGAPPAANANLFLTANLPEMLLPAG